MLNYDQNREKYLQSQKATGGDADDDDIRIALDKSAGGIKIGVDF